MSGHDGNLTFDSCIGQLSAVLGVTKDSPDSDIEISIAGDDFESDEERYPTYLLRPLVDDFISSNIGRRIGDKRFSKPVLDKDVESVLRRLATYITEAIAACNLEDSTPFEIIPE